MRDALTRADPRNLPEVERLFSDFQTKFQQQNYGAACDTFVQAVNVDPSIGFRYFIARASGSVGACARITRRTREIVRWLDGLLSNHPNMHVLVDYDPDFLRRMVSLREENIAKGLPSVVLVTQGKAASIPVANIFNSGFHLPSVMYSFVAEEVVENWASDFARGGACYTTHLYPKRVNIERLKQAGIKKVIVHVRDPRQTVLSMVHHVTMYPDQLPWLSRNDFGNLAIADQLSELTEFFIGRVLWIQGWLDAESELDILFSTFEDFVSDRNAFTRRYLDYYGDHEQHFSWQNAIQAQHGRDQHFRSGRTDEWRGVFPRREAEFLTTCIPKAMRERFNWSE
jgi:hypothetical protein